MSIIFFTMRYTVQQQPMLGPHYRSIHRVRQDRDVRFGVESLGYTIDKYWVKAVEPVKKLHKD